MWYLAVVTRFLAPAASAGKVRRYQHRLRQGTGLASAEVTPPAYVSDPALHRALDPLRRHG